MNRRGLAVALCALMLAAATAATAATNIVLTLTLDEAIHLTLAHNLRVQIQRYNPLLDKYALAADYGVYEPSFYATAKDTFTAQPGHELSGLTAPALNLNDTYYAAGIGSADGGNAATPWGLQYNLTSTLDRSTYQFNSNGLPLVPFTLNTAFSGLTLDQPLLRNAWIDVNRATIQIAKKNLRYDELGFEALVMTNINATEQAYYELTYARENIDVQAEAVRLADQLVAENQKRVKAGVMTELDVAQSQSQLSSAQAGLLAARQVATTDENNLKSLITDHYQQIYDQRIMPAEKLVAVPSAFDLLESWQTALAKRPDVLQARVNIERLKVNKKLQFNQLFPQLDATGAYGRTGLSTDLGQAYAQIGPDNYPTYSYGLVMSVPLGNTTPRNNYRVAKASLEQARLLYRQVEQTAMIQIENEIETAKSDFAQVDATRQARVYAEQALTAEQRKLEVGTSTPFVVLQLQSNLTTARSAEIRALADYNEALAALNLFEGVTLERRNLSVKAD